MKNKSTHSGHCQACGRLQKLPNGVLAKHGYKVTQGFFSGVCAGSGELPYEKSCGLIQRFIVSAVAQLENVARTQRTKREMPTEPKAMIRRYSKALNLYYWYEATLIAERIDYTSGDGWYVRYSYVDGDKTSHLQGYEGVSQHAHPDATLETLALLTAQQFNVKYAEWLEHEADSLRRYIAWQKSRVTDWRETALLAHDAKDKQGFAPTEPAY